MIDLPSLKTVRLGKAESSETTRANCFYFCERLQLRGRLSLYKCNLDLPELSSLVLGNFSFHDIATLQLKGIMNKRLIDSIYQN